MSGIRFAWVKELDEVMTAGAAKREFLAMHPRPAAFAFYCEHPECKQPSGKRTRVTCVNYKKSPSEQDQSVVVHYRQLDEHVAGCPYYDPEEASDDNGKPKTTRNSGLKTSDAFDIFDPADDAGSDGIKRPTPPEAPSQGPSSSSSSTGSRPQQPRRERAPSPTSTRFIEDLAAIHVQAKKDSTADALLERDIRVKGGPTVKLRFLFSHMSKGELGREAIWYGGCHLKRYGKGFSLVFRDKVGGNKVSTYIASDEVEQYRYRRQLEELLVDAETRRYVTAYVWGSIMRSDRDGTLSLRPARLQHLAIILGPPKTKDKTQD